MGCWVGSQACAKHPVSISMATPDSSRVFICISHISIVVVVDAPTLGYGCLLFLSFLRRRHHSVLDAYSKQAVQQGLFGTDDFVDAFCLAEHSVNGQR